jgi:hypothetical protein
VLQSPMPSRSRTTPGGCAARPGAAGTCATAAHVPHELGVLRTGDGPCMELTARGGVAPIMREDWPLPDTAWAAPVVTGCWGATFGSAVAMARLKCGWDGDSLCCLRGGIAVAAAGASKRFALASPLPRTRRVIRSGGTWRRHPLPAPADAELRTSSNDPPSTGGGTARRDARPGCSGAFAAAASGKSENINRVASCTPLLGVHVLASPKLEPAGEGSAIHDRDGCTGEARGGDGSAGSARRGVE